MLSKTVSWKHKYQLSEKNQTWLGKFIKYDTAEMQTAVHKNEQGESNKKSPNNNSSNICRDDNQKDEMMT